MVDLDPMTGRLGEPVELCDEVVGSLLVAADGAVAVTARCAGEAVLWWLDPR